MLRFYALLTAATLDDYNTACALVLNEVRHKRDMSTRRIYLTDPLSETLEARLRKELPALRIVRNAGYTAHLPTGE